MAADKGDVFLFQKITSVWLTGNGRPPTAPVHDGRDKEVALEIGFQCYLGDEGQISLQAWPARPRRRIKPARVV